jgi:two-component system, chemotaxis family, CheB/CheR fusion protein
MTLEPTPEETNQKGATHDQEAKRPPTYVVGIGASAGGLEALERFFECMPHETGMAFVVVQHLSPDFKSVMDELLSRRTALPVYRVTEGMQVQADAVYLLPPKKDMIISNGRLFLTDKDPKQLVTLPIDHFFRSLAHDYGERAIGIILSGTGSDGSRGLRDIHEAGGLVIAQTPETAKFDGMPNAARQTGACDLVLPPEQMPTALLQYVKHPLWRGKASERDAQAPPESDMDAVLRLLREAYGIDFAHYKSSTVSRRIDRRLLLNRAFDLEDYLKRLNNDPAELNALYKDLLIGVTRFFRDPDAFQKLEAEVLPMLLAEHERDDEFRVWVAGCATGEEAYSLAMLVQECIETQKHPVKVKIFATDVHRASLDVASAGVYDETELCDVAPARRDRFFTQTGDGYRVSHDLREMVVFAPHNLIKDAPFTKLDLITCRNLLIYLQPAAQKKILSLFHFALKTGGVLFLGPSESPGELSDEFAVVDNHWKIYRKSRDIRLPAELRLPLSPGSGLQDPGARYPARVSAALATDHVHLLETYDTLLDRFMPPSLLVNERRELIETFGKANRYLHWKERRVSVDILDLVEPELRVMLSGALPRVFMDKASVAYKGLRLQTPDGERLVNASLQPLISHRSNQVHALIVLQEQDAAPPPAAPLNEFEMGQASRDQHKALELELRYTKENLQATIEELETSNEELQATNEELVASNEELQSTNEELHSVNEELYTVNAEYQKKITELTDLTADMDNLLESTQVHTLFLDRNMCIRKFTPRIAEAFNLMPQDVGRRIDTFTHNIEQPTLIDDVHRVMETGQPFEQQVRDRRGFWFLLRILPYYAGAATNGIVLTLIDLANVKRAEAQARVKDRQLASILNNSPHLIYIKKPDGLFMLANASFRQVVGADPVGKTVHELFPKETADKLAEFDQLVLTEGNVVETEMMLADRTPPSQFLTVTFPLRDDDGVIIGVGGIATDVSRLKQAEQQARSAVAQRDHFLAMLSHELRNPLGAVLNAASVLELPAAGETERHAATEVIVRQASQMGRLLDDLLEVSRITQNKIKIQRQPVRLNDIVEEAARAVQHGVAQGQLCLNVATPEESVSVLGDATRLQQMLVNLLTNATKYTPPGGRIKLELLREGDESVLRVSDTGVGMRADLLPRVFELFVQADETLDRAKGGMGVGLTLVRVIAELHGGSVYAHSDGLGKGSVFTVRLPLALGQPTVDGAPRHNGGPRRVLIVEDNEDSRRMLETLLRLAGHDVHVAATGPEGLEAILQVKPALALVDIGLPGLNGYELAQKVRTHLDHEDTYLVALTGYGRSEDRELAKQAGFDEHLVKPVKRSELERVLSKVLAGGAVSGASGAERR